MLFLRSCVRKTLNARITCRAYFFFRRSYFSARLETLCVEFATGEETQVGIPFLICKIKKRKQLRNVESIQVALYS